MFVLDKFYETKATHSAQHWESGSLFVLATPCMIAFMENLAFEYAQRKLPKEKTTVGTAIQVEHLAATKIGKTVHVVITHVQEHGRQFDFSIEVYDGTVLIGKGTHTRVTVTTESFLNRLS